MAPFLFQVIDKLIGSRALRAIWLMCGIWMTLSSDRVSSAQVKPADEELLLGARKLVDIRPEGAKPFELNARFRVQINVPLDGHLVWKWAAKDRWSREITMGAYHQVDIRKEDSLYISRNAPFTPARIRQLEELLDVLSWDVNK